VNEYVLAPQTLTQLDTLREMARAQLAAADTAGVESTFKEATPLLQTQLVTAVLVMAYWTAESAVAYHQAVLQPWIDLAPEAQQKVLGDHINATKQSLVKALDAGLTETNVERRAESVKLFRSTETAAVGYYNQQRRVLVDQLAKLPGAPPLISRKRESECPPPVLPLAGKENPSLAPGNAAPEEVYPPKSKFNEVEGSIVLQVSITETGCMEFAQVMGSSGVNELDEAALLWAERANFVPAEKDHKPVAGILPFKMKFRLGD
jgi:TonB family protein